MTGAEGVVAGMNTMGDGVAAVGPTRVEDGVVTTAGDGEALGEVTLAAAAAGDGEVMLAAAAGDGEVTLAAAAGDDEAAAAAGDGAVTLAAAAAGDGEAAAGAAAGGET